MNILKRVRRLLRDNSPAWLNVEVDRNFFQNLHTALHPPEPQLVTVDVELIGKPHWRRIAEVYAALDQYWALAGGGTYTVLMAHVEETTGQRCSKKLVAKWKLERGLR
jgi:hypothetical protein